MGEFLTQYRDNPSNRSRGFQPKPGGGASAPKGFPPYLQPVPKAPPLSQNPPVGKLGFPGVARGAFRLFGRLNPYVFAAMAIYEVYDMLTDLRSARWTGDGFTKQTDCRTGGPTGWRPSPLVCTDAANWMPLKSFFVSPSPGTTDIMLAMPSDDPFWGPQGRASTLSHWTRDVPGVGTPVKTYIVPWRLPQLDDFPDFDLEPWMDPMAPFDPMISPPGSPAPRPIPTPWKAIPHRRFPERPDTGEKTYDDPPNKKEVIPRKKYRRDENDPEIFIAPVPVARPVPFPNAEHVMQFDSDVNKPKEFGRAHNPAKAPKNVKERKIILGTQGTWAGWAFNIVTETGDVIDAIYNALPSKIKGRKPRTQPDKAIVIYLHFDKLDLEDMIVGLLVNQVIDLVGGAIGGLTAQANRRLGHAAGVALGAAL